MTLCNYAIIFGLDLQYIKSYIGFRFQKRKKLGLFNFNISKRGVTPSISLGLLTVGIKRMRLRTGILGLSFSKSFNSKRSISKAYKPNKVANTSTLTKDLYAKRETLLILRYDVLTKLMNKNLPFEEKSKLEQGLILLEDGLKRFK